MKRSDSPQGMTRARLLKIAAGVVGGGIGAYALYEFAPWLDGSGPATRVRRPFQGSEPGTVPIRELVRYATLAASGHNAQPWKFAVAGSRIQIHPDRSRRLPAVDPDDRELWISLGCALENLVVAARAAGYEPEITYPAAKDWIAVDLSPRKLEAGADFAAIPNRQNTRSLYDGRKLDRQELGRLTSISVEPGITLRAFESDADIDKVVEFVVLGNTSQFHDDAFLDELIQWIRFDKREALASMDGLYSRCMGSPQVPRWLGRRVVRGMAAEKQSDSDARMLRSSAGAMAIASATDDKSAWVLTGQVYERLALRMTSMDLKSAFLNQPNEAPHVREQFQAACGFGKALPQLLLRFGFAAPMPASFRRPVDDVIIAP